MEEGAGGVVGEAWGGEERAGGAGGEDKLLSDEQAACHGHKVEEPGTGKVHGCVECARRGRGTTTSDSLQDCVSLAATGNVPGLGCVDGHGRK